MSTILGGLGGTRDAALKRDKWVSEKKCEVFVESVHGKGLVSRRMTMGCSVRSFGTKLLPTRLRERSPSPADCRR